MLYYTLAHSKQVYGILIWGTAAMKYLNEVQVNMKKIVRDIVTVLDILHYLLFTKN